MYTSVLVSHQCFMFDGNIVDLQCIQKVSAAPVSQLTLMHTVSETKNRPKTGLLKCTDLGKATKTSAALKVPETEQLGRGTLVSEVTENHSY